MLACVVGIPVWALSNLSWPAVAEKFKNINFAALWQDKMPPRPSSPAVDTNSAPAVNPLANAEQPRLPRESAPGEIPPGPQGINEVQHRLQALGARYYLLETWGNNQELYHFYCVMAVTADGNLTRYFEAVEAEPLRAMVAVLREVEQWRRETDGRGGETAGR
jgi:hypothetical protein